jgi:hypothetical protein
MPHGFARQYLLKQENPALPRGLDIPVQWYGVIAVSLVDDIYRKTTNSSQDQNSAPKFEREQDWQWFVPQMTVPIARHHSSERFDTMLAVEVPLVVYCHTPLHGLRRFQCGNPPDAPFVIK